MTVWMGGKGQGRPYAANTGAGMDTATQHRLEARVLKVGDLAVARGDLVLNATVGAVLEFIRSPTADGAAAAAIVTSLERQAGIKPSSVGAKVPKPPAAAPPAIDGAAPKPSTEIKAATFGGWAWFNSLTDTQRAMYGVGLVALLTGAFYLWSKAK